ncbi:hypothetical protein MJD09_21430 [bacterium]|nr:hypothetical protein [bacterium]
MGAQLLAVSVGSLLIIWFIDLFTKWYAGFLQQWMPNIKIRILLGQLVWAILALLFWRTLYNNHLPESFNFTYFLFVLFIYSIRGLVQSFINSSRREPTE